jgi:hypothetical protein
MSSVPPDRSEQIGRTLLGLAGLFELAAAKLREFGNELITRTKNTRSSTQR